MANEPLRDGSVNIYMFVISASGQKWRTFDGVWRGKGNVWRAWDGGNLLNRHFSAFLVCHTTRWKRVENEVSYNTLALPPLNKHYYWFRSSVSSVTNVLHRLRDKRPAYANRALRRESVSNVYLRIPCVFSDLNSSRTPLHVNELSGQWRRNGRRDHLLLVDRPPFQTPKTPKCV